MTRKGIRAAAIVAVLIALIAVAAVGYVFITGSGLNSANTCETTTIVTSGTQTSTSTIVCEINTSSSDDSGSGPQSSSSASSPSTASSSSYSIPSSSSGTNTSQLETFRVHFNWSGNTSDGNSTDVQTGSGTFLITIDLSLGTGSANGTGHVELKETGLCTATNATDYSFRVSGFLDPVSGNLTLSPNVPNPSEMTAIRTCAPPYEFAPDILSWPAFYPSEVTLPATYGATAEGIVGGYITYQVTLA